MPLSDEERRVVRMMMEHPGWGIIVEKIIPERIQSIGFKMISSDYGDLSQVLSDQAAARAIQSFPIIVKSTVDPPEQPADITRRERDRLRRANK